MSHLTRRSARSCFVRVVLVQGGEAPIRGYDPDRGQNVFYVGEPGGQLALVRAHLDIQLLQPFR